MKINYWSDFLNSILIVFLCIFLFSCGGSDVDRESGSTVDINSMLVVGDSISTGYDLAEPWPNRLADILNISVNNSYSVNGVPTSYGLTYIEDALASVKPSHVVIFLGTNDAIRGSATDAINNLQEMINIAKTQKISVIIATLPVITVSSSQNARAAEISNAIREFSGVTVADVRSALSESSELLADGIHPNNDGQKIIAITVAELY